MERMTDCTNRIYTRVLTTGSKLADRVVTNDDLARALAERGIETSDEWIRTRTGIGCRHIASEGRRRFRWPWMRPATL